MKSIFKSFIVFFVVIFLFSTYTFAVPSVDNSEKVYDFADLFTSQEENNLYTDIEEFIENHDLDMAIVTIDNNDKGLARTYADDFYDYNDFGKNSSKDGLLFLMDMDTREIYVSTSGSAQLIYDDYRIDKILDSTYLKISAQDYYGCADVFIDESDSFANKGIPTSNSNAYIDEDGDYIISNSTDWSIIFLYAAIITIVFMIIALLKHRMIKKAVHAKEYLKMFNVTHRDDIFMNTHTTKIRISSESSGSSGRSSGRSSGGSSTHRSSSGRSHGGGGRKF